MFSLKRNQIIMTVLVFMIAVAAYLNTQQPVTDEANVEVADTTMQNTNNAEKEEIDFFAGYDEQAAIEAESVAKVDGASEDMQKLVVMPNEDAELSMADATQTDTISATITKKTEEALQNSDVAVNKTLDVDYFSEEKLLREQSRAQQVDQLSEYVANENLDQEAKAKAAANLIEIQERIEKESSAEALLKAKGFKEVYVRIDDETVDVVVNKAELTDTDIAQIEEIVNRKTGYSVGKINITPLNGVTKN